MESIVLWFQCDFTFSSPAHTYYKEVKSFLIWKDYLMEREVFCSQPPHYITVPTTRKGERLSLVGLNNSQPAISCHEKSSGREGNPSSIPQSHNSILKWKENGGKKSAFLSSNQVCKVWTDWIILFDVVHIVCLLVAAGNNDITAGHLSDWPKVDWSVEEKKNKVVP